MALFGRIDTPETIFQRAIKAHKRGDLTAATALFEQVIASKHPRLEAWSLLSLGAIRQKEDDLNGAEESYRAAISAGNPEAALKAVLSLGSVVQLQGRLDEAANLYQNFAESSPDASLVALAIYTIGKIRREQGELAVAEEYFESASSTISRVRPDARKALQEVRAERRRKMS